MPSLKHVGSKALAEFFAANPKYAYLEKPEIEGLIPRKHDFLQLFDTSVDLAGDDIDISSFIRESSDTDVGVAWRKWNDKKPPDEMSALCRDELCRVSVYRIKEFIKSLKYGAWVWDRLQGEWVKPKNIYPGISILLHCDDGGYDEDLGFTGESRHKPTELKVPELNQELEDTDYRSQIGKYVSLKDHSGHVAGQVQKLCSSLNYTLPIELLIKSGRWHDLGKAHEAFREMLTRGHEDKKNTIWAKSEQKTRMKSERRGFRHELVSALIALQQNEDFLLAYLVAAHHGKVRVTIQPRPLEKAPKNVTRYALGVWEGDELPVVDLGDGVEITPAPLSLECMELGAQKGSWTEKVVQLLDEYGPLKLAFLETIIRVADWRASAEEVSKHE